MNAISKAELSEYNFRVLIDKSGSMGAMSTDGTQTRWQEASSIAQAIAEFAAQVDSDGIDVITFGDVTKVFPNTTPAKVADIFATQSPGGSTPLHEAIKESIDMHFAVGGKKSFNVIVTDGSPDNKNAVAQLIIEASNKLDDDSDLSFLFLQVGNDSGATTYLTKLDDDLQALGAKFDIVDKKTVAERGNMTFEELFWQAQND